MSSLRNEEIDLRRCLGEEIATDAIVNIDREDGVKK